MLYIIKLNLKSSGRNLFNNITEGIIDMMKKKKVNYK